MLACCELKQYGVIMMDPETLRAVAKLALGRVALAENLDRERLGDGRDGLERLGAARALEQFAKDLEFSADALEADTDGD